MLKLPPKVEIPVALTWFTVSPPVILPPPLASIAPVKVEIPDISNCPFKSKSPVIVTESPEELPRTVLAVTVSLPVVVTPATFKSLLISAFPF